VQLLKNFSVRGCAYLSVSHLALKEFFFGMNLMSCGVSPPLFFLTADIAVLRISDMGHDIKN
jgi:hypothetical protein